MSISTNHNNNIATITIDKHLTFNDSSVFRDSLGKALTSQTTSLNINLSSLDFIDSSGLGMLMVTDNECKKRNVSLQLQGPIGDVKSLLKLTRCYERFNIID